MTVPLAMLGALAFLALRSIDLNIYAQVGLVTLIGLAAKNGILIVEVAEQHLEEGMTAAEAAIASAESRLRPILMTAIAALAGFLPLVVASTAGAQQSAVAGHGDLRRPAGGHRALPRGGAALLCGGESAGGSLVRRPGHSPGGRGPPPDQPST